jgi:hypothetical protein
MIESENIEEFLIASLVTSKEGLETFTQSFPKLYKKHKGFFEKAKSGTFDNVQSALKAAIAAVTNHLTSDPSYNLEEFKAP